MMLSLMTILTSIMAFSMLLAVNPLTLGIIILLMAMYLSISFAYSMSSWVAFLIFLIYMGGMLVMFSYFVSIIPNQTITFMLNFMMMMLSFMLLLLISIKFSLYSPSMSLYSPQLNIMYLKQNMMMLMMLASILLFTMIVVVKLTILSKGPLRSFM